VDDVARAVEALRQGSFVLVYDGDGREEETDLVLASEFVSPDAIRTMRKDAGGLICVTVPGDVRARLGLPFMSDVLRAAARDHPMLAEVRTGIHPIGVSASYTRIPCARPFRTSRCLRSFLWARVIPSNSFEETW